MDRTLCARVTLLFSTALLIFLSGCSEVKLEPRLRAYLEARERKDTATVQSYLAPDARRWWGAREGEGSPITVGGGGPWSQWDEYFNAQRERGEFVREGRTIKYTQVESNDFYRLIERDLRQSEVTVYFNDDALIEGILFRAVGPDPADRFDEFKEWAAANRPDDLAYLMPEGEIIPDLERAARWRVVLNEWRTTVGLPIIE